MRLPISSSFLNNNLLTFWPLNLYIGLKEKGITFGEENFAYEGWLVYKSAPSQKIYFYYTLMNYIYILLVCVCMSSSYISMCIHMCVCIYIFLHVHMCIHIVSNQGYIYKHTFIYIVLHHVYLNTIINTCTRKYIQKGWVEIYPGILYETCALICSWLY